MSKKSIKLNAPLRGHPSGAVIRIEVDKEGTPLERYWRDRFKDAKIDNCVEWVGKKASTKPNTTEEGGKK